MGSRIRENVNQIFTCFCEVVCPQPDVSANITDKYPETFHEVDTLKSVLNFTYPCEFDHSSIQHYSFVLTNEDSKWTFGFCRFDPKTDSALVFLSSLPWHDTFYKLLNNICEIRYTSNPKEQRKQFLEALYVCDVPTNGTLVISWSEYTCTFVCACPRPNDLPSIPENRNLTEYYSAVDAHNMAAIFASLLHERRVVFVSRRLPRLSACVQAAASLLYPMHWQHVFIPLLPRTLADYVLAPVPFLIGAPNAVFQVVDQTDMADVVVFDADNNTLQSPFDDLQNLPTEVVSGLRRELRSQAMLGDAMARAFLRALVALIGGYRDALRMHPGHRISFDADRFLRTRPPAIQPFLHKMLQLQIFERFIDERLHLLNGGLGFSDEFEKEICEHNEKSSSRLRQQYKEWKYTVRKEGSAFFKTVRSKVQEHGKDVRAACKDIKTRLKDRTESSSSNTVSPRTRKVSSQNLRQSHRSQSKIKASASYKRPLHVSKTVDQLVDASQPCTSPRSERQTLPNLASSKQLETAVRRTSSGLALSPITTLTTCEVSSDPQSAARVSDSERLLAEYGLDFGALSLHSFAASVSDPTVPINHIDPINSTDPVDCSKVNIPINPTNPANPTNPTDITIPINPTDTTISINPTNSTDPTNPAETADPTYPTDPANSTDPANFTDPTHGHGSDFPSSSISPTPPTPPSSSPPPLTPPPVRPARCGRAFINHGTQLD